jgi:hypothetical protein
MWGGNVSAGGEGLEEEEGGKGQERRTLVKLSCTRFHAARSSLARQISSPLVAWSLTFSFMAKTRYLSLLLLHIRKITSSLRAPTVDPGYPGAVRKLRASGHPGVPPGTGSFF